MPQNIFFKGSVSLIKLITRKGKREKTSIASALGGCLAKNNILTA